MCIAGLFGSQPKSPPRPAPPVPPPPPPPPVEPIKPAPPPEVIKKSQHLLHLQLVKEKA